ncbi:class IV adenylate cyclase [Anaerosalibacter sp. Marseille-P3206]|uniref:class IV adenylate cyclase n=1 Tax=Anaerosalibacter sp. Marseille-P3206 TaxID=1871005 RepID=UPI000984E9D9|nr:class IV adenylate cyclase [Anaerosalibacter sp. Marseille-P3206]
MDKELEVKVLNIDKDKIQKKLLEIGAKLLRREHQRNYLIDSEDRNIEKNNNSYLRIRESLDLDTEKTSFTLTLKQNIFNEHMRENVEVNTKIEDKEALLYILDVLGYGLVKEGFKERISYQYESIRFDIDTWDESTYPYTYMEIEVNKEEDLEKAINLLNIDKKNISTKSIVELREDLGK